MQNVVLAIDQGTTGTRAMLFDAAGNVLGDGYRAHTQHHPRPGWVEHDANEIWACLKQAVDEALSSVVARDDVRVRAVGLANQGETVLAWDRATGEPLARAIVWQDTRTQEWVESRARDVAFADYVKGSTGLVLDPYFSASKMRWLLDHVPEVKDAAERGTLVCATLDTWLLFKLTDGCAFATDASTAARTQLVSLATLDWDPRLLDGFGIPREVLPDVHPSDGYFGEVRGLPGLARGAALHASLVDQPAALFGHGCFSPGATKATYGTGCFVYANTGAVARASSCGLLTTLAWQRAVIDQASRGAPTFALDGGIFAAGSVVEWLKDKLGIAPTADAIEALAASADPSSGIVFVPALSGLAAPHWDRRARGAIFGLDLAHGRAEVARAALEGITYRVAEVVRAMNDDSAGTPLRSLRVDGGLTRSSTMLALQASWLGVPVELAAQPETTALGVAMMAMRAVGIHTDDDALRALVRVAQTVDPMWSDDEREERAEAYRRAITHTRQIAAENA